MLWIHIHGHEYGGTNPTMINALDLNCNILALKTRFNIEMLKNKKAVFFNTKMNSIKKAIKFFENNYDEICIEKFYIYFIKKIFLEKNM